MNLLTVILIIGLVITIFWIIDCYIERSKLKKQLTELKNIRILDYDKMNRLDARWKESNRKLETYTGNLREIESLSSCYISLEDLEISEESNGVPPNSYFVPYKENTFQIVDKDFNLLGDLHNSHVKRLFEDKCIEKINTLNIHLKYNIINNGITLSIDEIITLYDKETIHPSYILDELIHYFRGLLPRIDDNPAIVISEGNMPQQVNYSTNGIDLIMVNNISVNKLEPNEFRMLLKISNRTT